MKSLTSLWMKRKKYYGIVPSDRRCYFFTTKIVGGKEIEVEKTEHGLGFCKADLSSKKLLEIYEKMKAFEPKWIIIQPSLLILFMQLVKKYQCKPITSISYIEVTENGLQMTGKRRWKHFLTVKLPANMGVMK